MNALTSWITRSLGHQPGRSLHGTDAVGSPSLLIPIQDAQTLFTPTHRQAVLAQIARLTGLPGPHHQALVLWPIRQYASFVQQLPASQAHHHASLGGLLDHTLEVIHQALLIRRGRLLPIGGEPERIARQHDLWTYAVAMAALLHDLGKTAVDQWVTLYGADGQSIGTWDPLAGPMTGVPRCHAYTVTYRPRRRHGFHERVTPLLVHHIMPTRGLAWLASEQALFAQAYPKFFDDDDRERGMSERSDTIHAIPGQLWGQQNLENLFLTYSSDTYRALSVAIRPPEKTKNQALAGRFPGYHTKRPTTPQVLDFFAHPGGISWCGGVQPPCSRRAPQYSPPGGHISGMKRTT
ncbi:TraI domain-containing protein [Ectothiorhodospira sp. BSL-9]|uniref:TraI domain-containing protein n=1 Tax=Ectothiorhodospira sp. BSL-9 TaxID=1442136 RepID=UPI0007B4402D|nr:TraI domain-containing protein [Ectothiorhodospira sp. BSL-9]ANB03357.1 hypothetical protein ECTOBSL9_2993 [Ectothiorhodospira sp. BSL-9]